jgi:tol-pal system protein YbgF
MAGLAQKREILDLQRDMANLQDQMRTLQRTVDEKLATLGLQVQQTLDAVNKNNTGMAVLESGIRDRMNEQGTKLVAPVATIGTKLDQMTTEFQAVSQGVADLTQRMSKLEAQVLDLRDTLKVVSNPPAAPSTSQSGSGPAATGVALTPPAGMSADQLYNGARRDQQGGNFDLAMQGYEQYLKWYPDTQYASAAQFNIGQIYYDKNDFPSAIKAFDTVLEHYSDNQKTPDAMYMKGMALLKSGQSTAAGREFVNVIKKYPRSEVAPKARDQLKALGMNPPSSPAATSKNSSKKKRR